jgi:ArsR family transcriptional regulator, arsenate/arsenite/antimonite-responsive transcriptional repressor
LTNVDAPTMPRGSTVVNTSGRLVLVSAPTRAELPVIDVSAEVPCCAPIAGAPLSADEAADLARVLKALADPARLRLLSVIQAADGGEACQCDLTAPVGLSQPTVSHHLRVLHEAGLVTREKRGPWAYYRAVPARLAAVASALTDTRP